MKLHDIFAKDISRTIEGVVKADDESQIGTEVSEYVLTNEASQRMESLLDAYNNYAGANGAWVSGFFGSGKSHMLKMLAHLLGDVDGQKVSRDQVVESFIQKTAGNGILRAAIEKSRQIPAKSILFNIDQKATLQSKDQPDALLSVFVKVFNESCGFYGQLGHVARFERDLVKEGIFGSFKGVYQEISSKTWEEGRTLGILQEGNIAKAYARVTGQDETAPTQILSKYRSDYSVSIEDFANDVREWLDSQDGNYRLNFYVDEVGQFIADNTKLMLNLQTVAETLATRCNGRAWVLVTSQEDVDAVIGDRTSKQGNDFSKIQARFKNRVKLTSADVEEVIQKRLLEKTASGAIQLGGIYAAEANNFKTLFDFADGSRKYRIFQDEEHFTSSYPFITYQYTLFQDALKGLSAHNAFEGNNLAVGARSMLGVFQDVIQQLQDTPVGELATFDRMFEGIRHSLKSQLQGAIITAEDHLSQQNLFAVQVLKALFLVKYVPDFKATPRNLTILMFSRFGLNMVEFSNKVKDALNLLEQQTYIQLNGSTYEYLTSDEKDIEHEIKSTPLDSNKFGSDFAAFLTGDILKSSKVRYVSNGQDFPFGVRLDDSPYGQQKELTLHFISPEYEYADSLETLKAHSSGKDELRVVIADDGRLMADLRLYLRTEKYLKLKSSSQQSDSVRHILEVKGRQLAERRKEVVDRLRNLVAKATMVANASEIAVTSEDAAARIDLAFQDLIARTYPMLSMLGSAKFTEDQIQRNLKVLDGALESNAAQMVSAGEQEILNWVTLQNAQAAKVTVKSVDEHFVQKPYGWSTVAMQVQLAKLIGLGKVAVSRDGVKLARTEAGSDLKNTARFPVLVLTVPVAYRSADVRALADFYKDFFLEPQPTADPLELAAATKARLQSLQDKLTSDRDKFNYPFMSSLSHATEALAKVCGQADDWYLTSFRTHMDELQDFKSDVIDPIESFINGQQKRIYDDAAALLRGEQSNLTQIDSELPGAIEKLLDDPTIFRGGKTPALNMQLLQLREVLEGAVNAARSDAQEAVGKAAAAITGGDHFLKATDAAQADVLKRVEGFEAGIAAEKQIVTLKGKANAFQDDVKPALFQILAQNPKERPTGSPTGRNGDPEPKKTVRIVPFVSLELDSDIQLIETMADIEDFVDAVRRALKAEISNGTKVTP
ncbi:BREX system P-loop protein BrxC [Arthrobacter sp. 754]|uniref:BREX system P-loop protein BrxC n=1 Tax=Arthrobacter sp. 754 TaxID=3156315 RepID=UPI003390D577